MSNPFGTSNQGGYQGPPTSTQAAPQQGFGGGAGYGGYGGFGGFQSQPSYGGFGGFNPMFGGLGGLGFNPMMGMGFMQPMPFFGGFGGGYGGGFGGFGGGFSPYQQPQFNPMFGGLGGLGFNPMMGGQFMQPMQKFDPYQQQMFQPRGLNFDDSPMGVRPDFTLPAGFVEEAAQQNFPSMDMRYRGGPQMSPEMRLRREQDMRALESQANASLTGATGASNPGMMALQQAALRNASPQELATPVENRVSMPSNDWWKTPDAETQYQQEQAAAQQQRAMNPGGRSIQDWQNEYNQLYPANRMTMNVAPSLEQFIQRRSNPISFPGMPGFTL